MTKEETLEWLHLRIEFGEVPDAWMLFDICVESGDLACAETIRLWIQDVYRRMDEIPARTGPRRLLIPACTIKENDE